MTGRSRVFFLRKHGPIPTISDHFDDIKLINKPTRKVQIPCAQKQAIILFVPMEGK